MQIIFSYSSRNDIINSNIENLKSNSSDALIWSGSAYNTEFNLSESIYNFREIIIETIDGCASVSIIANKTTFMSGYNFCNSDVENTLFTVGIQIDVQSNTCILMRTTYVSHTFAGGHASLSAKPVIAIYGRV